MPVKVAIRLSALFASWGLPEAQDEYRAIPERKFRLDVAWPAWKVCVEQQGGVWNRGKHGRGSGIVKDMERQNILQIAGWLVLQFTPSQIWGGYATDMVKEALRSRGWKGGDAHGKEEEEVKARLLK